MTARRIASGLSLLSLALGLALAVFRAAGWLTAADFQSGFLYASLAYFIFVLAATSRPDKSGDKKEP